MHEFTKIAGTSIIALVIGYVADAPDALAVEDCYRVPGTNTLQTDDRIVADCFAAKGNDYMAELYRKSAEAKAELDAGITKSMAYHSKYCTGGTLRIGATK